jgi:hypothetical protein
MLAHKSIDIRPELWRRARLNAEMSDVALRDYISYLLAMSEPVTEADGKQRQLLSDQVHLNRDAKRHSD